MSKSEQDPTAEILTGKKILLVDDLPIVVEALENIFYSVGAQVSSAENGQKAIEILQKNPDYDFIITDFNMPYVNGVELILTVINNPSLTTCQTFIFHTNTDASMTESMVNSLNQLAQQKNSKIKVSFLPKTSTREQILSAASKALL